MPERPKPGADRVPLCLPVPNWPGPDQAAWATAHRRGGLLDDDGLAVEWAAATNSIIASGYGRFLSFLAETDGLLPDALPTTRVTRERVEAYVAELRLHNHSSTVAARVAQLARAVCVLAPTTDWTWLRRIGRRLRRSATPARDDRARLLPSSTLFNLATSLMQRAETSATVPAWRRALLFRDGLMLAMLCVWAPRARNVAETMIGTNLQRRGDIFWAVFGPDGTKNGRPIEVPLPHEFTNWVERYLGHHRPVLVYRAPMSVAGDAFWISHSGVPLTAKEVGQRISAVTKRELGKALNPHLFRKIISTELAIHDPAHVGVAQPLLGHADYRTTQKAYNLGRAIDAARQVHNTIQAIRNGQATSVSRVDSGIIREESNG
jgi:integrase/recombinase XerD